MGSCRMHLSKEEVERYREIGAACAQIVEGICKEAKPGRTEVRKMAERLESADVSNKGSVRIAF